MIAASRFFEIFGKDNQRSRHMRMRTLFFVETARPARRSISAALSIFESVFRGV